MEIEFELESRFGLELVWAGVSLSWSGFELDFDRSLSFEHPCPSLDIGCILADVIRLMCLSERRTSILILFLDSVDSFDNQFHHEHKYRFFHVLEFLSRVRASGMTLCEFGQGLDDSKDKKDSL